MLRYLVILMLCFSGISYAGDVELTITSTTNYTAKLKTSFWAYPNSEADTTGTGWNQSMSVTHTGTYDTGIAAATAAVDSGGIVLDWADETGTYTGYRVDFDQGSGAWVTLAFTASGVSTYTHEADDDPAPRRGMDNYRVRSFHVDGDTTWSAVSILDELFANQAVQVYAKHYADDGTSVLASATDSEVFISYPVVAAGPDTAGVFAGVTADTTSASNVILWLDSMTIAEDAQVQFEWSNDGGSTYFADTTPLGGWNVNGSPSTTVWDSIHTLVDLDDFYPSGGANVDFYTRFRLRDDEATPNETGWNENQIAYTRATDPPPAAPANIVATAGNGTVGLNWDDNSEGDLADYSVYRGVVSGTRSLLQSKVAISLFNDNTAANGTEYFYTVTAVDDNAHESSHSTEVNATPAGADTTPPDTTGVFQYATFDTTTTSNVVVEIGLDGAEDIKGWTQWKLLYGGTWSHAEEWVPGTATAAAFEDTIRTTVATSGFSATADTVYVRWAIQDTESTPNETGWNGPIKKVLTRATPATGGSYRSITIDSGEVDSGLTDYVLLVSLSGTWLEDDANGGDIARSDGNDISFTSDSAGNTLLDWEIESYDNVNGVLVAWVLVPSVSSTVDHVLYMHYGDSDNTTDRSDADGVWDDYTFVMHMVDVPSYWTVAGNDLTISETGDGTGVIDRAAGKVGPCQTFVGSEAGIQIHGIQTNEIFDASATSYTFQAMAYVTSADYADYRGLFKYINGTGNTAGLDFVLYGTGSYSDNSVRQAAGGSPQPMDVWTAVDSAPMDQWNLITLVFDEDNSGPYDSTAPAATGYTNGVASNSEPSTAADATGNPNATAVDYAMICADGRYSDGGEYFRWAGHIDEVRFRKSVLSADHIAAEYTNYNTPSTFYTLGAEQ